MRYFHQPEEYWLERCTYRKWAAIYRRNLIRTPPIDYWGAAYFGYKPPDEFAPGAGTNDDDGEWESGLPDVTE